VGRHLTILATTSTATKDHRMGRHLSVLTTTTTSSTITATVPSTTGGSSFGKIIKRLNYSNINNSTRYIRVLTTTATKLEDKYLGRHLSVLTTITMVLKESRLGSHLNVLSSTTTTTVPDI
jgi:hypothetical protein